MLSELIQVTLCVLCFADVRVKDLRSTRTKGLRECGDVSDLPGTTAPFHGDSS